jgi:biopolymer transport protein ExbD
VEKKNFADITIRKDGKIFLDKKEVSLSGLLRQLNTLHRNSPKAKVLISGDKMVSYEMIIAVMDTVRKSGITGVSLETKWKE